MTSQMRLLRPVTITDANMITNIAETGTTYSALATYAVGDEVIYNHHTYESLVADNLGNAVSDDTKWLDLGATNPWAMFDNINGTQTTGASIDVSVTQIGGRIDGLALLNLAGETVQVTVTAGGAQVYDETFSLISDENITDWYAYFSEEIVYKTDLIVLDMPLNTSPTVRVQIDGDDDVACGIMTLGQMRELGATLYGARVGIIDYSRKETDDFGNVSLVERAYAKRGNFQLRTEATVVDSVARLLTQYRATPAMWIGTEEYASTWIFGWVREWGSDFVFQGINHTTLEIEGLV